MESSIIRGPVVVGRGTVVRRSFVGPYRLYDGKYVLEYSFILDGVRVTNIERMGVAW